ncbi:MAG: 50S ribosomal protein L11 methyltransferase, partial [Alphaproteobacteria bacterium]|nr:50S ribosomal protein L11 methyltransferase [Alphaproteobacteria bacterium]
MTTAYDCFIQKNTILTSPPLVPELKLHLANDATTLWQMTESEMKNINLPLPYWAFAWAGGQALARYILDYPKLVKGKAVLDIGAGSGIVGLSALLSLASRVDFKEIDPFAAESIRLNLKANNLSGNSQIIEQDLPKPGSFNWKKWDIILAGDVFY